jgi:hypothetical protein
MRVFEGCRCGLPKAAKVPFDWVSTRLGGRNASLYIAFQVVLKLGDHTRAARGDHWDPK